MTGMKQVSIIPMGKVEGLREDLHQLIRVCLTNSADIQGFVQANYPKEYGEFMEGASTRKDEVDK